MHKVLKRYWGFDEFRSPQLEIIESVLSGRDTIALLPTGGGKSLCYQLPALLTKGKVLVISPLISLMQDQIKQLEDKEILAKAIYSGMPLSAIDAILDNFVHGPLKLLYVSPERVQTELFQTRFYMANVAFVAIDEAHCISQWGHDFRPSYLDLKVLREIKPNVPIIALTATATSLILQDIEKQLGLRDVSVFTKSFARENINFVVIRNEDKSQELLHLMEKLQGTGIIYQRSRVECMKIAELLRSKGYSAAAYHGGMTTDQRASIQAKWFGNAVRIMVATNAFGMGIDKPDVRFVIHQDIPPSIEEYYQEAGRAGRDGKVAYAVAIVNNRDIISASKSMDSQYPSSDEIKSVYTLLCRFFKVAIGGGAGSEYYFDMAEFCKLSKFNSSKVYNTLRILERQNWLALSESLKLPSRVLVVADPRELHNMYPEEDLRYEVLCQLLRMYDGIFIESIEINETQLSRTLNIPIDKIILILKMLEREGMIHYDKSLGMPKITYLMDRPDDNSFRIDEKAYQVDRKNAQDRLEAIIQFFTGDTCRQAAILEYFGEKATVCGKCDICRGSGSSDYSKEDYVAVLKLLEKLPKITEIKSLLLKWPINRRNRIQNCLEDLHKDGLIKLTDDAKLINLIKDQDVRK